MSTALPHPSASFLSLPGAVSGALRLAHWGVIRAAGADAASFLHGQLSNDITHLRPQQARLAAYCTAQGRMLASFVVTPAALPDSSDGGDATELWLACRADLLAATLKRLAMFVLRAKARLSDASAEVAVLGLSGSAATAWLASQGVDATLSQGPAWSAGAAAGGRVVRLPDAAGAQARWLWLGPTAAADAVLAALPAIDTAAWDALEISAGVVPVQAATIGAFVPQMLNYELVGGVDFKKGCYPGQEIVARSHYLGKLKRRGVVLAAPTLSAPALAGQEIWWSGDTSQPAGQVAQAAALDDGSGGVGGSGWLLLAEIKLAALGDAPDGVASSLHLGAADGPALTRLPLPYALPQEENQSA